MLVKYIVRILRMQFSVGLVSVMPIFAAVSETNTYYCSSEFSGGLMRDQATNHWTETKFVQMRFTLQSDFSLEIPEIKFSVASKKYQFKCHRPYAIAQSLLACRPAEIDSGASFLLNTDKLRFQWFWGSVAAYILEASGDDSILISGTCELF